MAAALKPASEIDRIFALRSYGILDTPKEDVFDDIVWLAAKICDVPIAAISLVDDERQWFKAEIGLNLRQTERSVAFCAHTILDDTPLVVPDATADPRFSENDLVTSASHFRFYAGMPLSGAGHKLGALCVIDRIPRELDEFQLRALRVLSRQVEAQLEVRKHAEKLAAAQKQKDELASLLVHDLKNPLSSMLMNAQYLASGDNDIDSLRSAALDIELGAVSMQSMITNILELAQSDSGELKPKFEKVAIRLLLSDVERACAMRSQVSGHRVSFSCNVADTIDGDRVLLQRLVENLVDNAFRYTRKDKGGIDIEVTAPDDDHVEISVSDEGEGVPDSMRTKIFERYARLESEHGKGARSGFGLGLASCRMIAEAHHGKIWVEAREPRGSVFRVRLPRMQL